MSAEDLRKAGLRRNTLILTHLKEELANLIKTRSKPNRSLLYDWLNQSNNLSENGSQSAQIRPSKSCSRTPFHILAIQSEGPQSMNVYCQERQESGRRGPRVEKSSIHLPSGKTISNQTVNDGTMTSRIIGLHCILVGESVALGII